jgi:hypothetical protein
MNDSVFVKSVQRGSALLVVGLALCLNGCPDAPPGTGKPPAIAISTSLYPINLSDPIRPTLDSQPIQLCAARNEWASFTLEVKGVFSTPIIFARLSSLQSPGGSSIGIQEMDAYQILPVPVQVNPGYVRRNGLNSANRNAPCVLLPVPFNSGRIPLGSLRDPTQPANPATHPNGGTVLLWVDLHVPLNTPPGDYAGTCDLADKGGHSVSNPVSIKLSVYDFELPEDRHLQMVGTVNWERLAALYPKLFGDTLTPNLINRGDPRYRQTITLLDRLKVEAENHRAAIVVPGLRPTVKWPAGTSPQVSWDEFDSLIRPWMRGDLSGGRVPVGLWPLPSAPRLGQYDSHSRVAYWAAAATHFDQLGWLDRSPIWLQQSGDPEGLVAEAARILAAHPTVAVALPLLDEQLAASAGPLTAVDVRRLITAAAPLVSSVQPAPTASDLLRRHWLPTNLSGLVPSDGAGGDERDIRSWAWLAFLRGAQTLVWDHVLPDFDSAEDPADPQRPTWFYPGQWFGVSEPLPTLQLKWLRRAEQDYEYLWLAEQRGEAKRAMEMARLVTKPVELQPGQTPNPAYSLLSGTTSQQSWDRAQELLAQSILLHGPGRGVDQAKQRALLIEMLQWSQPQERPLLLPRSAAWSVNHTAIDQPRRPTENWLNLQLGLDVYSASDTSTAPDQLQWGSPPPSGWEIRPQPSELPRLQMYRLQPATLRARFDLNKIDPEAGKPLELHFVNGFRKVVHPFRVRLPVALSERREGPVALDGKLSDWSDAEAIQDGPLVLMLNRPDLHEQRMRFGQTNAKLYSAWNRDYFYLAFATEGLSADEHKAHNDVDYHARRAWGEDLCEALMQPIYADDSVGPVLHVVCKPNGADWVEWKKSTKEFGADWQTTEGAGIRYATTRTAEGRWRGEVGIPWKLINATNKGAPVLLRFNFSQHRQENCESASWCGPVDYGRDDSFMGVLYLRSPLGAAGPEGK